MTQTIDQFAQQVIDNIQHGMLDKHLGNIIAAVGKRHAVQFNTTKPKTTGPPASPATNFANGDIVRFTSSVRPKYLAGHQAVVVKINRKRVKIKMLFPDQLPTGTRFQGVINCPTNLLTTI